MIVVGFTGTRHGMTKRQQWMFSRLVDELLREHGAVELHHGCCIGADATAHYLAGSRGVRTVGHPCNLPRQRAALDCDVMLPAKPPLVRNCDIVDSCSLLIAAPAQGREVLRSGTWATLRYARTVARPRWLLLPDYRTPMYVAGA